MIELKVNEVGGKVISDSVINTFKIDFGNIIVSLLVLALGLIAIAASLFRLKNKDVSLLNFGLFSSLYGLRWLTEISTIKELVAFPLNFAYVHGVLTYLVVIPFFALLVTIFGRGLYKSILLLLYSAIGYAILAIAFDVLSPGPLTDNGINPVVVVLWGLTGIFNLIFIKRKDDSELMVLRIVFLIIIISFTIDNIAPLNDLLNVNIEHSSFIFLMIGLGYVALHHTFANAKKLQTIEDEIEIARKIQQSNLPRTEISLISLDIAARYVPMSTVAGDFYDCHKVDETKVGIIIADVSGHGVGAALIGSMLKIAFASQAKNVNDPAKVLSEINRILHGKLELSFVTACTIFIDLENETLSYATAGHPPPLLWRSSSQEILQLTHGSLILGPFPDVVYENTALDFKKNDRLVLYTDGIIETSNKSGEFFGTEQLELLIKENLIHSAERSADLCIEGLARWSGKSNNTSFDDDLTLMIIDRVSVLSG